MLCTSEVTRKLFTPVGLNEDDHIGLDLHKKENLFRATLYTPGVNGDGPTSPSYKSHSVMSRIPERKKLVSDKNGLPNYHLGITDYTVELIWANYKDNIYFSNKDTKVAFGETLLRSRNSDEIAKRTAKYFEDKTVPSNNLIIADGFKMAGFQEVASINACLAEGGYNFYFKQGCGKTLSAIALISSFAKYCREQTGFMHRSIVICPNSVRLNWKNEIARFSACSVKSVILDGTQLDRVKSMIKAFQDEGHDALVCIVGYDTIPVMWEVLDSIDWQLGIADEIQYAKSHLTQRWKYLEMLRDKCEKRLGLTGTPIANTLLDLYTLFEWTGKGFSGFSSFSAFKNFYAVYDQSFDSNGAQDGIQKLLGFQNVPFLKERLAKHSFIITKEQALPDLPPKTYDILESTMTPEQTDVYKQLASQLMVEIEGSDFTSTLTTNHVLTKLLRLAEITAGYAKWDDKVDSGTMKVLSTKTVWFDPVPKIETLMELLREKGPDEKTLVWSNFTAPIRKISERLSQEGINHVTYHGETSKNNRAEAYHRFNYDPECKVWVSNPSAGGVGLNLLGYDYANRNPRLTTNTTHQIYYCMNWSSLDREQSSDRPHRKGTRVPVRTTDLVVPYTIDEEIRLRVVEKQITAMEISDLRGILKNVLKMEVMV